MRADDRGKDALRDAHALYYVAPGQVELRPARGAFMAADARSTVVVRSLWSGISRGTERLVFEGRVPASEHGRMRAPFQDGDFPFPVKYGYCSVGVVVSGPDDLMGKTTFALHPHQTIFAVPQSAVIPLPDDLPAKRAILAANMETALNALWDSGASAGDRIAIVGAGAVGLLVASLAARLPGTEVIVCDTLPERSAIAEALGATFVSPSDLHGADADVVFHASATSAGLATSLAAAAFEARVVELSWYGTADVMAPLGAAFHSQRLRLLSSQAGAVSAGRRARWTHARRLTKAVDLLRDPRLDALITDEVAFAALPASAASIFSANPSSIVTAIRYAAGLGTSPHGK